MSWRRTILAFSFLVVGATMAVGQPQTVTPVRWHKTIIDPSFRSEGVAVADVNRDRRLDIIVGDYWYQSPTWKRHPIRPPRLDLGNGASTYSDSFCCFADDFNRDGWPDVLVVGFPGKPVFWYENPRGQSEPETGAVPHWKPHLVAQSACNETPAYTNLFGDGKKYLVMATQPEGQLCWFSPPRQPDQPWERHPISIASLPGAKVPGTDVFAHGLGAGDVNDDGRVDVFVKEGWWEQPADARKADTPWTFHPANLGDDCADMYALDLNSDKRADILSSSAHARGVWWHEQNPVGVFTRHLIDDAFSQSHALNLADIDGNGTPDLVTGKRWWAHGPSGDVEPGARPVLCWFSLTRRSGVPVFTRHVIDDASGIGTQFVTRDVNGDKHVDVVVSSKRGVFLFEQIRQVEVKPLADAHAHNDYEHPRPLLDALENGFCSVEADVHLINGKLLVAHDANNARPDRTLQSLYLDPLRERARRNDGRVYKNGPASITLLIDVKTDGATTYAALRDVLSQYRDILTEFRPNTIVPRAAMVVISGGRPPLALLGAEPVRYAAYDGRLSDLDQGIAPALMPLVSQNWSALSTWHGDAGTSLPPDDQKRVAAVLAKAHRQGYRVRFWATPDTPAVWQELHDLKVDLINTDDLAGLRGFLLPVKPGP